MSPDPKLYDMYARFFRWASDRLAENGILAFISNRSFIDSRTFDGFRKTLEREFNEVYIVDLGGDVRLNPKLSGTKHNVFGIQIGVAISFLVKRSRTQGCSIRYSRRPEFETAEEKLAFLGSARLAQLQFESVQPDATRNWINLSSTDFHSLIPLATKHAKSAKKPSQEKAIFKVFSFGVVTNRDEWVYDDAAAMLEKKVRFLIETYNADRQKLSLVRDAKKIAELLDGSIKWTRAVKRDLQNGTAYHFDASMIVEAQYRPFVRRQLYFSSQLNEMPNLMPVVFGSRAQHTNRAIVFTDPTSQKPFMALAVNRCPDMHFVGAAAGSVVLGRGRLLEGNMVDNLTEWGFEQFRKQYQAGQRKPKKPITKDAIFHYVYGVLHDPVYREKYSLNLKREFPRIPFYKDFWQWAEWGERLMALHIDYDNVEPWPLTRVDLPVESHVGTERGKAKRESMGAILENVLTKEKSIGPKPMLRADKVVGSIMLDTQTMLSGIPAQAWTYKLGNRSALEWVLDQYKEKKSKDPTIRERFNTYRFADYKEKVIELLGRVTRVSIETQTIVDAMGVAAR